jgi:hypothetical protein
MPLFSICLNYITNIHPMVVVYYIYVYILFIFFKQVDPMLLMTIDFFSFSKVPQLPSNLFINVVNENRGVFFFHSSLKVTLSYKLEDSSLGFTLMCKPSLFCKKTL